MCCGLLLGRRDANTLWCPSTVLGDPNQQQYLQQQQFQMQQLMANSGGVPFGSERLAYSTPGSPLERRPEPIEVIGSAENLVGRVSVVLVAQWCGVMVMVRPHQGTRQTSPFGPIYLSAS